MAHTRLFLKHDETITSLESHLQHRFLRSLSRISKRHITTSSSSSSSSTLERIRQRTRRIKIAAYSSMARTAGPRRAWSRALIIKIRRRAKHRSLIKKRKRISTKNRKQQLSLTEPSRTDRLRKLVPGGGNMDLCKLLEETAGYVKYLSVQVKVMQRVADAFSA